MPVAVTNLLAGPGTLWSAPFGSTEPVTPQTALTTPWVDVGGTNGGADLMVKTTWFDLAVDQIVDTPGRRMTSRDISVKTNLAEATLANLALALNEASTTVVTSGTGVTAAATFTPSNGIGAFNPPSVACILQGNAPAALATTKFRRVILRAVHNTAGTGFSLKKDGQTFLGVELHTLYVSASIAPYIVTDDLSTP